MGQKTFTDWICDGCKTTKQSLGTELPHDWEYLTLQFSGRNRVAGHFCVCPACLGVPYKHYEDRIEKELGLFQRLIVKIFPKKK